MNNKCESAFVKIEEVSKELLDENRIEREEIELGGIVKDSNRRH